MKEENRTQRGFGETRTMRNLKVIVEPPTPEVDTRWTEIKISGKNLHPRSYHTMCIYERKLYTYGGYDVDRGIMEDFWSLNLTPQQQGFHWQSLMSKQPNYPGRLRSHTALVHKDEMILFGGQSKLDQSNNKTWIYNFRQNQWRTVLAQGENQPPKVQSHGAIIYKDQMIVFGGYMVEKGKNNNQMYALDLNTWTWKLFFKHQNGLQNPLDRSSFGWTLLDETLWLFGGTQTAQTLNDLWKFNLAEKTWSQLKTISLTPQPRRNLSLVAFQNHLFIFGGIQDVTKQRNDIYAYDIKENRWCRIHNSTNSIYQCSPTMKKKKQNQKKHQRRSSSPIPSQGLMVLKSTDSPTRDKKHTKQQQILIMKKIVQDNKHKKFLQHKRSMLKEFEVSVKKEALPRRLSPTSENMKKTLEIIGHQEYNIEPMQHQVRYDETGNYILGKKPCARDAQAAAIHNNQLLIFGGDRHLMSFCDLFIFDLMGGLKSKALYSQRSTSL